MLVLFDIDMTLVTTDGVGIEAIESAGASVFGRAFDAKSIRYGGRIDPLIFAELLEVNGVEGTRENVGALTAAYAERLTPLLVGRARAMPGAAALVEAVAGAGVTAGLLTGNVEATGSAKLRAAGFEVERFEVRVWGDHSPHEPPAREHLPPLALDRYEALVGARLAPDRAVVVGDTVHDVACARAHGLRCLGVASGKYSGDELSAAGADRVVSDLTDTGGIVSWLMG